MGQFSGAGPYESAPPFGIGLRDIRNADVQNFFRPGTRPCRISAAKSPCISLTVKRTRVLVASIDSLPAGCSPVQSIGRSRFTVNLQRDDPHQWHTFFLSAEANAVQTSALCTSLRRVPRLKKPVEYSPGRCARTLQLPTPSPIGFVPQCAVAFRSAGSDSPLG